MSEYAISEVRPGDRYMNDAVNQLLEQEGIRRDKNLDYTAAMLDDDYNVRKTNISKNCSLFSRIFMIELYRI